MCALKIRFPHNLRLRVKNNKGRHLSPNESNNTGLWKWINQKMHNKSLKRPSYTIVTKENVWSFPPFDCVHKKIIALFIDGVKLSTLKSPAQCGLIKRLDSCSQFTQQLKVGGIKYIPLLLYKCKRPSRQNPCSKLMAIKTPTARTDREIKSQHQTQHAVQLNKAQDNNICRDHCHAPTVRYLNTFDADLYPIWRWLN